MAPSLCRTLLFIHSKCNSLHLSTPNSQSIPRSPSFLLGNHEYVPYVCVCFCFVWVHLCHILDSTDDVQSPRCVRLFVIRWTAARQASLSLTTSQSSPEFMSIESVMPHKSDMIPHISDIIRYFSFSFWLASLSMISSCTHAATNGISFFMAESYSIACKYPIFFIHSSVRAHLGCFHVLATVNSAAKNIGMPFGIVVFSGYMP